MNPMHVLSISIVDISSIPNSFAIRLPPEGIGCSNVPLASFMQSMSFIVYFDFSSTSSIAFFAINEFVSFSM